MAPAPEWVFRIDDRHPDEIFKYGFTPWGHLRDFFQHIIGGNYLRSSNFISASENPLSAMRFYGGSFYSPLLTRPSWLYQIRGTSNIYSSQRTAARMQQRIAIGTLDYVQGDMQIAQHAISLLNNFFAYQEEWFIDGPVPYTQIYSAWRVNPVQTDPNYSRLHPPPVRMMSFLAQIQNIEYLNLDYEPTETTANEEPWDLAPNVLVPITVDVPQLAFAADLTVGAASSTSFVCPDTNPPPHGSRKKRSETDPFDGCLLPKESFVEIDLKNAPPRKLPSAQQAYKTKLYFQGSETGRKYALNLKPISNSQTTVLHDEAATALVNNVIYDTYGRVCIDISTASRTLQYALTFGKLMLAGIYAVENQRAAINDYNQRWELEAVDPNYSLFKLISNPGQKIADKRTQYSLFCSKTGEKSFLYSMPTGTQNPDYEEIYVLLGDQATDISFPVSQASQSQLVDLQLSWLYDYLLYSPVPTTGWSQYGRAPVLTYFYDLFTMKIYYINGSDEVFALKNNRTSADWDWVRWADSNFDDTDDETLKWIVIYSTYTSPIGFEFREIMSFKNSDYLKVIPTGSKWGGFYTTKTKEESNSIRQFVVRDGINI